MTVKKGSVPFFLNLAGAGSALGQEGLLYALQVRNQLLGCIYLGPRPAEAYSAEERRLFERVAHQVAVALHSLRLEAQRTLIEELASGALGASSAIQVKAREVIRI
jgi:GAF domain-containing protein